MNAINQIFTEVIAMMIHRQITKFNMYDVLKQLKDIREESITNTGEDNIYEYIITYPNDKLNLKDWREEDYDERYEEIIRRQIENDSDYDNDSD